MKYYDGVLFFDVQRNLWLQSGDPTGSGAGGESVFPSKYFKDEITRSIRMDKKGLVCMASHGKDMNASQFFITMRGSDLEYLDGTKTIFGEVVEGFEETLMVINDAHVDDAGRPYRDFRILKTHVLEDPFPDDSIVTIKPSRETVESRIGYGEEVDATKGRSEEEINKSIMESEAKSRAVVLEMVGDIPDANMKPPENILFICKLNPVTEEDDLEIIFARFGTIRSCEILRDKESGESLQYGFIEFETEIQCREAFYKMNNVLIDDRRIKVDFSQSVSKLWNKSAMKSRRPRRMLSNSACDKSSHKSSDHHEPSHRSSRRDEPSHRSSHRDESSHRPSHRDEPSQKSSRRHKSSHKSSDRHEPSHRSSRRDEPSHRYSRRDEPSHRSSHRDESSHRSSRRHRSRSPCHSSHSVDDSRKKSKKHHKKRKL